MSKGSIDVRCPRCSGEVHHFRRDPHWGLERYRCKDLACPRQFAPDRTPRPRKYPKVICPKCGANMGIFKHLSDALRFRCNRHNAKGHRRCTHKLNIPSPWAESFDLVVDPKNIRLIRAKVQLTFHWNRMRFWLVYVPRYDASLGHNLSARHDTQAARDTFAMTYHASPDMRKARVLTHGLWSYVGALQDLGLDSEKHLVYKSFFQHPNNNALERKWSNFKTRARPFRGFKSDLGLTPFVEGQIVYHNFFEPSPKLKGITPAKAMGIKLPNAPSDWMLLSRLLTS